MLQLRCYTRLNAVKWYHLFFLFTIINLSQSYQTPNVSAGFPELLVKITFAFGKLWTFKPPCFQLPPVDCVKPLSGTLLTASSSPDVSAQHRHCSCNQFRTRLLLPCCSIRWVLPAKRLNVLNLPALVDARYSWKFSKVPKLTESVGEEKQVFKEEVQ